MGLKGKKINIIIPDDFSEMEKNTHALMNLGYILQERMYNVLEFGHKSTFGMHCLISPIFLNFLCLCRNGAAITYSIPF